MIKTSDTKLWLWFGVLAGIGLENKYSMLIFGAGIVVGLLFASQRRLLANAMVVAGGAIAFAIFAPNLLWNVAAPFSVFGIGSEHTSQWARRTFGIFLVFWRRDSDDATACATGLDRGTLVFPFCGDWQEISGAGLGVGVYGMRNRDDEPARVLTCFLRFQFCSRAEP